MQVAITPRGIESSTTGNASRASSPTPITVSNCASIEPSPGAHTDAQVRSASPGLRAAASVMEPIHRLPPAIFGIVSEHLCAKDLASLHGASKTLQQRTLQLVRAKALYATPSPSLSPPTTRPCVSPAGSRRGAPSPAVRPSRTYLREFCSMSCIRNNESAVRLGSEAGMARLDSHQPPA
jgi:hypothetical protein